MFRLPLSFGHTLLSSPLHRLRPTLLFHRPALTPLAVTTPPTVTSLYKIAALLVVGLFPTVTFPSEAALLFASAFAASGALTPLIRLCPYASFLRGGTHLPAVMLVQLPATPMAAAFSYSISHMPIAAFGTLRQPNGNPQKQ